MGGGVAGDGFSRRSSLEKETLDDSAPSHKTNDTREAAGLRIACTFFENVFHHAQLEGDRGGG